MKSEIIAQPLAMPLNGPPRVQDKRHLLTPVDVSKRPTTKLVPKSADKISPKRGGAANETRIIPLQQKLHSIESARIVG